LKTCIVPAGRYPFAITFTARESSTSAAAAAAAEAADVTTTAGTNERAPIRADRCRCWTARLWPSGETLETPTTGGQRVMSGVVGRDPAGRASGFRRPVRSAVGRDARRAPKFASGRPDVRTPRSGRAPHIYG